MKLQYGIHIDAKYLIGARSEDRIFLFYISIDISNIYSLKVVNFSLLIRSKVKCIEFSSYDLFSYIIKL